MFNIYKYEFFIFYLSYLSNTHHNKEKSSNFSILLKSPKKQSQKEKEKNREFFLILLDDFWQIYLKFVMLKTKSIEKFQLY